VDANGRFDLETAVAYARALAPYGLVGMKNQVIRWTFSCKPSSRSLSRSNGDGENLFHCKTHEISYATRNCGRIATSYSSIAH